jgi:anti-anti-sigma factor
VIVAQAVRAPAAEDVVVDVMLLGEIDVTSVPSLSRYLRRILDRNPDGLVFDLAGDRFLDCAAAQTIVGTGRMLPDGRLPVLCHPRPGG